MELFSPNCQQWNFSLIRHLYLQVISFIEAVQINSWGAFESAITSFDATSIGTSAGGHGIPHVTLSNNGPSKPNVGIICNIGGNKLSSVNFCMNFIQSALMDKEDFDLTSLLKRFNIHIVPNLNIDGSLKAFVDVNKGIVNGNGIDLTRSFPNLRNDAEVDPANYQPEVKAVLDFLEKEHFSSLIIVDSSRTGVLYPLSYVTDEHEGVANFKLHQDIADKAVSRNPDLVNSGCHVGSQQMSRVEQFEGTLDDYCYLKHGTLTFHFHTSCAIDAENETYKDNSLVFKDLIRAADRGLHGRVVSPDGQGLVGVTVTTDSLTTYSRAGGYFWLPVAPGTYQVKISFGKFLYFIGSFVSDTLTIIIQVII